MRKIRNLEVSSGGEPMPPFNDLARYICAGWLAYRMGIGVEYALRRYVPALPGAFWQDFAEKMARSVVATDQGESHDAFGAGQGTPEHITPPTVAGLRLQ